MNSLLNDAHDGLDEAGFFGCPAGKVNGNGVQRRAVGDKRIDRHLPFPLVRRSHINKDRGRLQAYESADVPNAETLIERGSGIRFVAGRPYVNYTLHPKTGKTHQLRVHMNSLGLAILGDDFYPDIVQRAYDDFSQPLELVARELRFDDPLNGEPRRFVSHVPLGAGL